MIMNVKLITQVILNVRLSNAKTPLVSMPFNSLLQSGHLFILKYNARNKWRSDFCGVQASVFCWRT